MNFPRNDSRIILDAVAKTGNPGSNKKDCNCETFSFEKINRVKVEANFNFVIGFKI